MIEDNIAIRLKGFIDYLGISSSQFADQCGIPRPSLSQLLNGRNKKISDVIVGQIHAAYPELSVLWLMFGEGTMLVLSDKDAAQQENPSSTETDNDISNNQDGNANKNEFNRPENPQKSTSGYDLNELIAERDQTIKELRKELDSLKKHPRRVIQITVYYDDSTFETFYPGGTVLR